eukprot:TRINITY_DN6010_c0_g1_i1.p1 TRINITY_DN6010_c0_g1~~TRINITY_DN6010_c0_g1_i1.p1  ORF type:complete len:410 (+),score=66.42 TRINITY_DN6010_c0_g1_i1:43-1272(+)
MGGGDLNFKKSWHPHTRHNIEKVWKAEQQALAEKRKTEQLMKELHEERAREEIAKVAEDTGHKKKSDKVEWMYTGAMGAAENRDDYLLGKPVDKTILLKGSKQDEAAILDDSAFAASTEAQAPALTNMRDMSAKVREDPMFAIKKRQQEALRMMALKSKLGAAVAKKKKKSKKSKKSKHKHRDRDAESDDNDDTSRHRRDRDSHETKHSRPRHRSRSQSPPRRPPISADRRHSPSPTSRRRSPAPTHRSPVYRRRSRSPPRRRSRSPRRRSRSPPRRRSRSPRRRSPQRYNHRNDNRRDGERDVANGNGRDNRDEQQAAAEDEDKRKLEAMLANGKWRQEDRKTRVEQYKAELQKEEDELSSRKNPDFIKDMNEQSWTSDATASLEDRLRRNKHYIQRTEHALESGGLA